MIYILSPRSSQAQSLVRLMREAGCTDRVVAVRLTDDPKIWTSGPFSSMVAQNRLEPGKSDGVIVPTGAPDTEWFLARADCRVGEVVHRRASLKVFDKLWLLSQATQAGLLIPLTWTSVDDISVDDYPFFYKEDYERGLGIRGLVGHAQDLPSMPVGQLIYQEYIDSPGTYGVGFLARDGEILVSYTHFESSSIPSTGGVGVILEPCPETRPLEYTERLVRHLGYSGWGLAEFKHCPKRHDYVLMEINAKFWGSLELAFRNEPKFLRLLFGLELPPQNIGRVVMLNYALAQGPKYLTRHRYELLSSRWILYRGWPRSLVVGLLPRRCRTVLRKVRSVARQRGQVTCMRPHDVDEHAPVQNRGSETR